MHHHHILSCYRYSCSVAVLMVVWPKWPPEILSAYFTNYSNVSVEVEEIPPPTTNALRRRPCLVGVLAVCYKLPHSSGAHIK